MRKILFTLLILPVLALAQNQEKNYIKSTTYKGAGATLPVVQITYFDGLGRPIQQIANGQSNTGKDIVTHVEYDAYGRKSKEFLPYANTASSLNYNSNAITEISTFYNTPAYENTLNPYSEKLYEASPLNRVLKQAAPGNAWAMGSGHEIKMDYHTNAATEVKQYTATATWNATKGLFDISINDDGNYASGQLYKSIVKDENNTNANDDTHVTKEYKDKEGRVVLKRVHGISDVDGTAQDVNHDTYYVFDQFGNLTYVIPPLANGAITEDILKGLCYQYKYDNRNRLAAKKLPGKQWEYIVYDLLDRPVATGPAFSPFGDGTVGMIITDYDVLGRITQTGWKTMTVTESDRATWQNNINSGSNPFVLSTNDILTKNYYDNYSFTSTTMPTTVLNNLYPVATNVKGLVTGSWVRVLIAPTDLSGETSYTVYDTKYRPVRTRTDNYLGGYTQVENELDFIGKTLITETRHKRVAADDEILIKDSFTYSAQERMLVHKQQIGSLPEQLIASNTYDALGQLISKKVGGTDITGALGLQKVDYTYNIRGWLKGINDTANLTEGSNQQDLFAFKLNYNNPATATPLFNGNISETYWKTKSDNILRKYNYTYDNLNRLLDAKYQKEASVLDSYGEHLKYDKNGNITWLQRFGEYDDTNYKLEIDSLAYSYDPVNKNQLMKVYDNSNNPNGFKDDSVETSDPVDDYIYDSNGNLIKDDNKGITSIVYNHLNLPTKITFVTSGIIEYLYDAIGQKLQKKITSGANITIVYYLDGFQYKQAGTGVVKLEFFPHAEGYVSVTVVSGANKYNYVFNYTDHLGNVRLSYTKDGDNEIKIVEENNYYPFGLKHVNYNMDKAYYEANVLGQVFLKKGIAIPYKYKYNGMELQDELGLGLYAMDARQYDPAIGRFTSIDPVVHYKQSPYVAFYNNPVYWADPSGMTGEHYNWDKGRYENDKGNQVTFGEALASQGLNENGTEKTANSNEKDETVAQVGLLAESFDFQKTTSNWQAAGVTGLRLTVTNPKRKTTEVEFELEVGIPMKLANGTIISERVAQLASAEAANETAATIGTLADLTNGKFYDAPALVKTTFAKLMQRNLDKSLKSMLELPSTTKVGSRVNSPIQSNIKTKEAVWARVSALEAINVWVKSFF